MIVHLLKYPVEKSSFSSWAKISDDVAKVAILAIPVMLYSDNTLPIKLMNIGLLLISIFIFLSGGRTFRQYEQEKENG